MYNKFPGKDITEEDIKSKIPLVANFSKEPFEIAGVVFNGKKIPVMACLLYTSPSPRDEL